MLKKSNSATDRRVEARDRRDPKFKVSDSNFREPRTLVRPARPTRLAQFR